MKIIRMLQKKGIVAEKIIGQQLKSSNKLKVVRRLFTYSLFVILIGILLIGSLWLFVWQQINYDYDRTIAEASLETMNLTKAFEEHVRRVVADADRDLLRLKLTYEQEGLSSSSITAYALNTAEDPNRNLVAIYNEQGVVIASFIQNAIVLNRSDREYFMVHRKADSQSLVIDRPIKGLMSGQATIPMTRRINKPDGSFGGIVFIGLKASNFIDFYNKIDLGQDQLITLTGMDGFLRARQTNEKVDFGDDIRHGVLWKDNVQAGHLCGTFTANAVIDGINRMCSYRVMPEYPLIVAVGKSTKVVMVPFEQRKKGYILGASLGSLFILVISILLIKRHKANKRFTASIEQEKDRLSLLINSISDEIWFADTKRQLSLVNPSVLQEFGLDPVVTDVGEIASSFEVLRADGSPRPVEEAPPLRALQGEFITNEIEIVRPPATGMLRHREVTVTPVKDASGNIMGSVFVVHDINERKRAEEMLLLERAKLEAVFETVNNGIVIMDTQGGNVSMNAAAMRFHEFNAKANLLTELEQYTNQWELSDADGVIVPVDQWPSARALRGDYVQNCELHYRHLASDHQKIAELHICPVIDDEGKVTFIVITLNDITERNHMEGEIIKHRDNLRTLVEERTRELECQTAILAGINRILLGTLTSETEEELGERCLAILEEMTHSKFGFIGEINDKGKLADIAISNPGWNACNMPDQSGHRMPIGLTVHGLYGRVLLEGKGFFTNDPSSHPDSIGLPEGHPPLKSFLGVPLILDGKTIGVVALGNRDGGYRDEELHTVETMSHSVLQAFMHKRAQQALIESKGKYHQLFNSIDEGFFLIDVIFDENDRPVDMYYVEANAAATKMLGQDFTGQRLREIDPNYEPYWYEIFGNVARTGESSRTEQFSAIDNMWFDFFIFKVGGKESRRIANIFQNTTQRKRMEAELVHMDRINLVGEMAAGIGHEVRNPMTTVRGYLQWFSQKEAFTEHRESFTIMIDELDRANSIITEFLSLAKDKRVNLILTDLNKIIRSVFPLLQADAFLRGNGIELELQDTLEIFIDGNEMRQCILNLVGNGLDSMPNGGKVIISTASVGNQVVMTVRDQGQGMTPEVKAKLWTPFFTTKEKGTGLGLPVCFQIAQRHEATIEVETGPEGTAFHFIFSQKKLVS